MTYKYFNPRPVTLDEGKAMYRALADANHPDHGGSVEVMQAINAEWDDLKGRLPKFVPLGTRPGKRKPPGRTCGRKWPKGSATWQGCRASSLTL